MDLNDLLLGTDAKNKSVLSNPIDQATRFFVTGGVGSIGRELISQLLDCGATHLSIFDNCIEQKKLLVNSISPKHRKNIRVALGDVSSASDLKQAVSVANPNCVLHLAALKHVDLAEQDPYRTYKVNVEGTFNLLKATVGVRHFMLMSTDKAVFPAGLMGATKRMAELAVMLYAERHANCDYSIVRSGNVIGSSGSALNRFVYQIENTQEVSVTHPGMARFFVSNVELASLIIRTVLGNHRKLGSAISYIVDCGVPIQIVDVVQRIAACLGKKIVAKNPREKELVIKFTGIRAGEKLEEQMHQNAEILDTDIEKIKIGLDEGFEATLSHLPDEFRLLRENSNPYIDELVSKFYRLLDAHS